MSCRDYELLLGDYVDGTIDQADRATVDVHLAACPVCRATVVDFAAIRSAAAALEPLTPPARVWHAIEAAAPRQTGAGGLRSLWVLRACATAAMAAILAVGLWRVGALLDVDGPSSPVNTRVSDIASGQEPDSPEAHYAQAIARLEEVTSAQRDALDPEIAGTMDAGLLVVDRAITESRAALQSEPSDLAQDRLHAALRHKVTLLQDMLTLTSEMRKGTISR
jgi:hypothetical protein